jgi:DsbC/DsbD-like thiol-disulfide interchange protein
MVLAALMICAGTLAAQPARQMGDLSRAPVRTTSYVTYDAEPQVIEAGKRSVLALRFQIMNGYHVNSHTPKSELLIPTKITLQPAAGVKAEAAEYPAGTEFSFSFSPKDKLDVYAGDLTVRLPVVAAAGTHELDGTLRYQACDHAACYPPKSLPVRVLFTAK